MMRKLFELFAAVLLCLSMNSFALDLGALAHPQSGFLPADKVFLPVATQEGATLILRWQIAPAYYLYKSRFQFQLESGDKGLVLGEPRFSGNALSKHDPNFGTVEVFHREAAISLDLSGLRSAGSADAMVKVTYQGCADAGLCYPPQTWRVPVHLTGLQKARFNSAGQVTAAPQFDSGDATGLAGWLASASPAMAILSFIGLGVALSFTPCVLPMLPILAAIIIGPGAKASTGRRAGLAGCYVLGMSLAYGVTGAAVGYFGAQMNLAARLQEPLILLIFAGLFALLSLSMFDVYELRLPDGLANRLQGFTSGKSGGTWLGVVLMGALSVLVVSPCVSAPLAGALLFISSTGNTWLGAALLFALGIGMGMPLLLIGMGVGGFLPRTGPWMIAVKRVFGTLMLAVAALLVSRVLPAGWSLWLWGVFFMVMAVAAGALDAAKTGWERARKGAAFTLLVYAILLCIGAASGGDDPRHPLSGLALGSSPAVQPGPAHAAYVPVNNMAELRALLAKAGGKPVMLDLYADWCTSCIDMERQAFRDPTVLEHLQKFQLLRADVTRNSPDAQALLSHFGLFGPPSILFFDSLGREIRAERLQGTQDAAGFADRLQRISQIRNLDQL